MLWCTQKIKKSNERVHREEKNAVVHTNKAKRVHRREKFVVVHSKGVHREEWDDENCDLVKRKNADIVLWPVYTDFNYNEWNTSIKNEYAEQAEKIGENVFYVNSVCFDSDGPEIARGGAALFHKGNIMVEAAAGEERVLVIEIA